MTHVHRDTHLQEYGEQEEDHTLNKQVHIDDSDTRPLYVKGVIDVILVGTVAESENGIIEFC